MKYLFTSILLILTVVMQAQNFSLPSQIDRSRVHVNPAFTGSYETAVASLMHKTYWLGPTISRNNQNFEFHNPLKKQSMALGVQAGREEIGGQDNTEAFLNYCYRIRMKDAKLAFGLKAGIHSKGYGNLTLEDEDDLEFNESSLMPNFGFGVAYYTRDYFVGLSMPYFFSTETTTDGNSNLTLEPKSSIYVLTAGGKFSINSDVNLEPVGALVYSPVLKPSYSLVVNANYKEKIVAGVGYRASEAIIVNAGYYISQQISFMYSYDYSIGHIGTYSSGSHEIGLLIYWGFKVNTVNPRNF